MNSSCDADLCSVQNENGSSLSCDTCRARYHCSCVSVSEELFKALSEVRGFFWRCDNCFEKDVCAQRFGKLLTIMQNMTTSSINASNPPNQHDNFINIIDDDVMEASPTMTPTNKRSRSLTPNIGKYVVPVVKRTKIDFDEPDPDVKVPHNDESAADYPAGSSSASNDNIFDIDSCVVRQSERYFHLSQFDPSTATENIKSYVVSKLKCDPKLITCHKLVSSKRENRKPLTFVSFKVGTTKKLAKKIINKNIWPQGISIKAFEDHSKNGKALPHPKRDRSQSQHQNQPPLKPPSGQSQTFRPLSQRPVQQRNNRNRNTNQQPIRQSNRHLTWNESYRN